MRIGRYETVKPIASGGMATVYLGRALGAGGFERLVAIKMMHAHIAEDPDFVAMFLDEARLAARVRHPNVVATIDVQESEEQGLALVMEYVEGPSLHALLRKVLRSATPSMPPPVMLRIFLDALMGLHAAHELKDAQGTLLEIIHRDVSPQNVLVGVDGVSKITDFGVARASSRLSSTRGGQLKGKIGYMAPEQLKNEDIDRRSDVYAAGVVLWELLTGRRRFRADSEGAVVSLVLTGPRQSPRDVVPSVPEAIDAVCMRAMERDPSDRYPTAMAFAEALEEAAISSGIAIATPRAVAAFVNELGAHERPDLSALEDVPSHGPASVPSKATVTAQTVTAAPPTPRDVASSTNDVGSLVVTNAPYAPGASRKRMALFAGGAVLLVSVGVLLAKAFSGGESSPVIAARPADTAVATVEAADAAPPAVAVEAVAPAVESSASVTTPSTIPPAPKPEFRRPGSAAPKPPTAFRPSDL